jgi:hypothetical protein
MYVNGLNEYGSISLRIDLGVPVDECVLDRGVRLEG